MSSAVNLREVLMLKRALSETNLTKYRDFIKQTYYGWKHREVQNSTDMVALLLDLVKKDYPKAYTEILKEAKKEEYQGTYSRKVTSLSSPSPGLYSKDDESDEEPEDIIYYDKQKRALVKNRRAVKESSRKLADLMKTTNMNCCKYNSKNSLNRSVSRVNPVVDKLLGNSQFSLDSESQYDQLSVKKRSDKEGNKSKGFFKEQKDEDSPDRASSKSLKISNFRLAPKKVVTLNDSKERNDFDDLPPVPEDTDRPILSHRDEEEDPVPTDRSSKPGPKKPQSKGLGALQKMDDDDFDDFPFE